MLDASVIAFQVVLPLALLAWLAFAPAASLLGWLLQAAAVGLFLFALARVAMWTVPPWWTPWLYAAIWLAVVAGRLLRAGLPGPPLLPSGFWGWAAAAAALALLAGSGWAAVLALRGTAPPRAEAVDLPNPLGPGRYVVAHGGSEPLVNIHMKVLDPAVPRFRDWRGQAYAIDLFAVDALGLRVDGWRPQDPWRYEIFGRPVHAPCAGEVVGAENALPDMPVPRMDRDNLMGNHVLLRCGEVVVLLAHLRRGSVTVSAGELVEAGALLGEVGNSGNSSEPHLHLHAQRPAPPGAPAVAGEPLALRLDGRFLVRNARLRGRDWRP